ncbi:PPM-type phosphatase domain-containing protein [Meloidogyne graminicola]|uniref:protein-serine/threonine phosphatase n=1 Tax=Meloidogyne graminicola TaxID=189291 RepID=A0A8S9ZQ02_9BILA|nr:PPM-type phosphatase domain-containing protein [Meloidogyne graminicola]
MGQTLSEPITSKTTASCSNDLYNIGSSSMQGWRISFVFVNIYLIDMEDAHVHLLELEDDPLAAYFAVFDGHGGSHVAKLASRYLHKQISETEAYVQGRISDALIDGFLELDEKMLEDDGAKDVSGSTAVVVLIKDNCIYCANAGDSRAVVSVAGKALNLSTDHKPSNEEESKRIFAAGGWVEFNRVNGNLALSRALGDFTFKSNKNLSAREQIVTACPEVELCTITDEHEFIILACDGIWDVMSSQEVIDFCRQRLEAGISPDLVCEKLIDKCLAPDCDLNGIGCDNMTGRSQEDYLLQFRNNIKFHCNLK